MAILLIVEDDKKTNEAICEYLRSAGHETIQVYDGAEAIQIFREKQVDLAVLDIMLPKMTGLAVLHEIRQTSLLPVLMLTAIEDEYTQVQSFDEQADDYITKPISLEVLVAKVQAMLRRSYDYETPPPEPRLRGAVLDAAGSCLMRGGERIPLTKNELGILQVLLERPGQVVRREAIMLRLWESDEFVDDNTLTVNVNRLRKTLAAAGIEDCVVTHKGQGYSINA